MDFGTYHHSSRKQSELIRERIRINLKKLKILKELDKPLSNVIDIGFGLGFFSYEISKFLKIKNLVGLDTFDKRYIKNLNTPNSLSMQISEALHNPSFIDKITNYDGRLRNFKKD